MITPEAGNPAKLWLRRSYFAYTSYLYSSRIQWKLSFKFGKPQFKGHFHSGVTKISPQNVHIFFVSITSSEGTALFKGKGHVFSTGSQNLGLTSIQVGSITSCCSANEPPLLPRTDGWTHEFAIVNYHQSDRCLLKSSRQHKFIFLEQISNGRCKGVVWCAVQRKAKCQVVTAGLNAVYKKTEIKIKSNNYNQ